MRHEARNDGLDRETIPKYTGFPGFPSLLGVGFIASVSRAKLDEFLRASRADGARDITMKNPSAEQELFILQ